MATVELTRGMVAFVDEDLWQAYIKYQGEQRSLGYHRTEQEAHDAYVAAASELHGDWMPLPKAPSLAGEPVALLETVERDSLADAAGLPLDHRAPGGESGLA